MMFDTLLVVCPEHVDTLLTDGILEGRSAAQIQKITESPLTRTG